jgi:hypothetical protein
MLRHLKRWLGWESESDLLDLAGVGSRTPIAPPAPKPVITVQTRPAQQAPAAPARPAPAKPERTPLDVLDDPRLTIDKPADDGFDPYNTGAFNRSTSWERIGRNRKR